MREFASPLNSDPPMTGNLTDDVVRNAADDPSAEVLSRGRDADWAPVTAAEFLAEVRAVAKGLVAVGIESGDRVALLSATR